MTRKSEIFSTTLEYLSARYPPTLTVDQVGEITSEHPQTIRNMVSKGAYRIPSFKIGSKRVFWLIDVATFLDEQRQTTAKGPRPRRGRPSKVEQLARRAIERALDRGSYT